MFFKKMYILIKINGLWTERVLQQHLFLYCMFLSSDVVMSQVEKKAGLLRRTSSSKKPLKEKVVLMYDEIFAVSITIGENVRKV